MTDEVHEVIYNPATGDWTPGDLLATSGSEDCQDQRCSRLVGRCVGMHCARCGEPCGSQGHVCADVLAREAADERRKDSS